MDRLATGAWLKHAKHVHSVRALPPALAEHLMNPGQGPAALPPPLFDGNWGNYSTDCVLDDRIQSYVSHNLVRSFGLADVPEQVMGQLAFEACLCHGLQWFPVFPCVFRRS